MQPDNDGDYSDDRSLSQPDPALPKGSQFLAGPFTAVAMRS